MEPTLILSQGCKCCNLCTYTINVKGPRSLSVLGFQESYAHLHRLLPLSMQVSVAGPNVAGIVLTQAGFGNHRTYAQ